MSADDPTKTQPRVLAPIDLGADQMELVVRGANVGVWFCPLPFDELVWDEKVKEHFHLPPEARVTIDLFYERIHPDDRERTRKAIDESIERKDSYRIDYRTVSPPLPDGSSKTKWIRAIGRALYDASGSPIRFDGVTIDISEQKLAELAVVEREERYRLATRATNDAIWDWDLRTNHVRWNEAITTLFGFALDEVDPTGAWWIDHIHPDDREAVSTSIHAVIDATDANHWEAEYRFLTKSGAYADVFDRGYLLRDTHGHALRMIGAMRDLSDEKKIARDREQLVEVERTARTEAERQSQLKDEFLATLSHELRTPLNAILGWAQILKGRGEGTAEQLRGLAVIERNARAQAQIVDELLDMSRMLSGKLRLDVQRLDIVQIVSAAIETMRPAAESKNLRIQTILDPLNNVVVTGDVNRLGQILWNLLSNAVKFTPKGGRIQVLLERVNSHIEISVIDTGEGIRPEFLPFVFDRFRQADGSMTRTHGGLGLGLAIVKELVELHGGSVRAKSAGKGQGATFVVALPVTPIHPEPDSAEPSERRHPRITPVDATLADLELSVRDLRVLVVDDEADSRAVVAHLLEDRGAVVKTAASADEALAILHAERFDVLVSDIGMPGEDGYTFIRRVRALSPEEGGNTPAIALTAYARAEDRMRAVAAGFLLHVAKPVESAELVTMVAGAAGRTGRVPTE